MAKIPEPRLTRPKPPSPLLNQLISLYPNQAAKWRKMSAAQRRAALSFNANKPPPLAPPTAPPRPPVAPGTTNPLAGLDLGALGQYVTPDLLTLISQLQQQSVSPYADIINRQAKAQADSIAGFSQAGANQMAALVPQVQQGYQGAEERSAAFAKGMQDGFGMIEGQSAEGANKLLAQNQSPQTIQGNAGGAGVIGGLGLIPATEFGREGAAFTAAAAAQPQAFLNQGMLDTRGVWAGANQQLQDLLAQSKGTTGDLLQNFIQLGMQGQAQAAALKASGLDVAGKKLDLYSQKLQNALAIAKLTGVFKDPKTGKRYAIPQQPQDAPNVDVTLSREVGAWVDGSGIPIPYMQGVPPPKKTVKAPPKKPGVSPTSKQAAIDRWTSTAQRIAAKNHDPTGKKPQTAYIDAYKRILAAIEKPLKRRGLTRRQILVIVEAAMRSAGYTSPVGQAGGGGSLDTSKLDSK